MFMRNFKWYRKMKGGKWWCVRHYDSLNYVRYLWMHDKDEIDFPEFDGMFMDDIGSFHIKRGTGFSFEGQLGMQNNPFEKYGEN